MSNFFASMKNCDTQEPHNLSYYESNGKVIKHKFSLSSEFWARQAQREVVKMKNFDFSY